MLNIARKKYKDERVSFIREDILNFNGKLFDYIFLYSVYPHFEDKEKLFKHIYSLLKNNGKIIIAHSESKEKINNIHKSKSEVKNHLLDSAETTSNVMKKYFIINKIIDNKEMYFILGEKNI